MTFQWMPSSSAMMALALRCGSVDSACASRCIVRRQIIKALQELQGVGVRLPLDQFGEWLSHYTNRFHLVASFLELALGVPQNGERVTDLLRVSRPLEAHK